MQLDQAVTALQPLFGRILLRIDDPRRQEGMDATLQVITGWTITAIHEYNLDLHDTHTDIAITLHDTSSGQRASPAFTFGLNSEAIQSITHNAQDRCHIHLRHNGDGATITIHTADSRPQTERK